MDDQTTRTIKTELLSESRLVLAMDLLWYADPQELDDEFLGDFAHRLRLAADHYATELDARTGGPPLVAVDPLLLDPMASIACALDTLKKIKVASLDEEPHRMLAVALMALLKPIEASYRARFNRSVFAATGDVEE